MLIEDDMKGNGFYSEFLCDIHERIQEKFN